MRLTIISLLILHSYLSISQAIPFYRQRRMYELSPIPCQSQTACMEHASCVAGRCRCTPPYTYYASQCVPGGVSPPLEESQTNHMIVPVAPPPGSFSPPQLMPELYDSVPPSPAFQPGAPPLSPVFTQVEPAAPSAPTQLAEPPMRVSMGGLTYVMESLVQPRPPAPQLLTQPPPLLAPIQPSIVAAPPCVQQPICGYFPAPPPIVITPAPSTTTLPPITIPFRDPTSTTTEEPTTTTEEITTTEEPTTTTTEATTTTIPSTTTEEVTTTEPITTTEEAIITTEVLPTEITTTTEPSTTTPRPFRDEPIIAYPCESCLVPGTLCVGGSRCIQGQCLCRPNEEVIDGECQSIPPPQPLPIIPIVQPTVMQLQPANCMSADCCQNGYIFQNNQCMPPQPQQKIKLINVVVAPGSSCTNTAQCDRGAYCMKGSCQCGQGFHQIGTRCITYRTVNH